MNIEDELKKSTQAIQRFKDEVERLRYVLELEAMKGRALEDKAKQPGPDQKDQVVPVPESICRPSDTSHPSTGPPPP